MAKLENILQQIADLESQTKIKRTLLAVCPNSISVIKAAFRAAKRNNSPILFAATLNQVDTDGGYTGLNHQEFIKLLKIESETINYKGPYIAAIDHGGPWLKDIQAIEKWDLEKAMSAVKKSFERAIAAGFDMIHVDPTVDIFLPKDETINIKTVVERTIELIMHAETFRRKHNYPTISYEVGTEEVHGGLADEKVFDIFINELKKGLEAVNLADVWPCFIVGKVGTDLHTTVFDTKTAKDLSQKVKQFGSYIKGHYTDGVDNPQDYPTSGMGAANVGPEFTIDEYDALIELENKEQELDELEKIAQLSNMKKTLWKLVYDSKRWIKWLQPDEKDKSFDQLTYERKEWLIKTGCRYIWQHPEASVARLKLYDNLKRNGIDAEAVVLEKIEHTMDKYFYAFNIVNLNDYLK
jgi:tagatose-1,6-bisphosphate aldolase non-catalytic subunit AgaZ/GatZ